MYTKIFSSYNHKISCLSQLKLIGNKARLVPGTIMEIFISLMVSVTVWSGWYFRSFNNCENSLVGIHIMLVAIMVIYIKHWLAHNSLCNSLQFGTKYFNRIGLALFIFAQQKWTKAFLLAEIQISKLHDQQCWVMHCFINLDIATNHKRSTDMQCCSWSCSHD